MWRTCIRLNSSYKGLLARYVTPTQPRARAPTCERAHVKPWVCANRFCIFQADNLSILSTPIPPQIPFSSWHDGADDGAGDGGGGEEEKPAGLRPVVFGRKIMSLFKHRKFSFAPAQKIDFRTLSRAPSASPSPGDADRARAREFHSRENVNRCC